MRTMDWHNRNMKILIGICIAVVLIVCYRIFDNIQTERARAERMSRVQAVAVVTAKPERRTITPLLEFSGSLDPEWQADVAAKVDGRVERVYVNEGDHVTKGQVLAELEQRDTDAALREARGNYMDAQTNLRKAERDLERYSALYKQGAVSEQVADDYAFARDNAAAKLDAARGTVQAMESQFEGTVITAPADGIISKRYHQEGYYAAAGTPLFAIADISVLKTVINIPEGNISGVSVGNEAEIELPAFAGHKIIGRITRIAPVADLPAHTFAAEVSVDNTEGLLAGVFATVKLTAQPRQNVLIIPVYAIVMRDDQKTVFIVEDDNTVRRQVLDIGYTDDKVAEVLSGLKGDEVIVTEGHNKLREGSKVVTDKAGN